MEKTTAENIHDIPDGHDLFEADDLTQPVTAGVPEYAAIERMAKSGKARDAQKKTKK